MERSYNKRFREEAIGLALTGDKSIAQTAKDLGIKERVLYYWIRQTKQKQTEYVNGDEKLNAAELIEELNRLRKDNARLKEEREILKKAAVFFAREEQKR